MDIFHQRLSYIQESHFLGPQVGCTLVDATWIALHLAEFFIALWPSFLHPISEPLVKHLPERCYHCPLLCDVIFFN